MPLHSIYLRLYVRLGLGTVQETYKILGCVICFGVAGVHVWGIPLEQKHALSLAAAVNINVTCGFMVWIRGNVLPNLVA